MHCSLYIAKIYTVLTSVAGGDNRFVSLNVGNSHTVLPFVL